MIRLKGTDIIVISGERGTGKSTLAMHFARMFPRYVIYDALGEYQAQGFENIYIPQSSDIEEFERFCKGCWDLGNIMIIVDEAETFMPEGKSLSSSTFQIVMQGRHRNIGMIITTKRIAELKKTVVSQAKYVMLFRHFLKADVDAIKYYAGEGANDLKNLPDYRFMMYNMGQMSGPYKINLDEI